MESAKEDIFYTTLMNADFDTLKRMCLTDKFAVKICQNLNFWEKYNYNLLPI